MTDIEIAQAAKAEHITKIAERAGIPEEYLELYGSNKAKISPDKIPPNLYIKKFVSPLSKSLI